MFKIYKRLFYFSSCLLQNNKRLIHNVRPFVFFINQFSQTRLFSVFQTKSFLLINDQSQMIISRNKSKGRKKKPKSYNEEESSDEEDEDLDDDDDEEPGKDMKTLSVSSLRTDLILKTLLGVSRKKIEESFYENKIRVNGNVLLKKSNNLQEGDEVDLIKKIEDLSQNTLEVSRVKLLKVKLDPDSDKYIIKAWRSKSLIIKNYMGTNSWKEVEESN